MRQACRQLAGQALGHENRVPVGDRLREFASGGVRAARARAVCRDAGEASRAPAAAELVTRTAAR